MIMERDDLNGDGMISADEFKGPARLFSRLDADGNGDLTVDELRAGEAKAIPISGFDRDDADSDDPDNT